MKDYDITILYHPGEANVVVDELSRKSSSIESIALIRDPDQSLARISQSCSILDFRGWLCP